MDESFVALRTALKDRYDLHRLIGRGGMANVYLATDLRHGRPVAVKVLRASFGEEGDSQRFAREIETAARLQHPNILSVYDSGEANGALFFTMPYVEGETLRGRLDREHALPWSVALGILREVGDALTFAHGRGVLHRDIKPENILFFAGHAVVADFGIARVMSTAGQRLTLEGHGIGTPEYMSPEQALGEEDIDERTDVYALASVAYEMLSGRTPWTDLSPMAMMVRKNHEEAPVLTLIDGGIPSHVPAVLRRGLLRDVTLRYPDITSLLADLEGDGSTTVSIPLTTSEYTAVAPSIAVLPFANLSGDTSDEYLSEGISDDLIHALAQKGGLRVVARTSSFRFRKTDVDVRDIGSALKVESVLEGSVRRHSNTLRITARLIDTRTGFERWSERYEREFIDVFAVQDEIAHSIVVSLEGTLRPRAKQVVVASTNDMKAYELFLEGRFCWNQRTAHALRRSVDLLQRAVERDPAFAAAHAALAEACITLAVYGIEAPTPFMQRALVAAERSLALRPGYTDALVARASVSALHDWANTNAESDFELAVNAPQATATALQSYAMNLLVPQRRFEEAREHLSRASALDPLSPVIATSIGVSFHAEGNQLAAIRSFRAVLERDPQFGMAHYFLGRAFDAQREVTLALECLSTASTILGDSVEPLAFRAVVQANAGNTNAATTILADLDARARTRYVSQVSRAEILAALGDTPGALARLQQSLDEHASDLVWVSSRPAFRKLRENPSYRALLEHIGQLP